MHESEFVGDGYCKSLIRPPPSLITLAKIHVAATLPPNGACHIHIK